MLGGVRRRRALQILLARLERARFGDPNPAQIFREFRLAKLFRVSVACFGRR